MRPRNHAVITASIAIGLLGCTGSIGDAPGKREGETEDASTCEPHEPFARRLTVREYRASLRDLLGETEPTTGDLPPDTYLDGFDNNVATLSVSTLHVEGFMETAADLAADVRADPERRAAVFGCGADGGPDAACLESFVRTFGRRAYRRPLESDEVEAMLQLAASATDDPDPWMGATLILQAMLQSPAFLYRVEIGIEDPADPTMRLLTGHEMATRLSYSLWQSTPDDWLLDLADAGALDTAQGIEEAALQMLDHPRAREGLASFTDQWLRLPLLAYVDRSTEVYPAWSETLRGSMLEETRRLMADHVWTDGVPLLGALTARHTYVDDELAALYGVSKAEEGWVRVELSEGATRGGLLTQASFLTVAASSETTAPILRGKFVRDVLLCTPVAPPPKDIPDIEVPTPGQSVRELLEQHRKDDDCSVCHDKMDPIGFGFERYDLVGGYRETDPAGNPLTGQGDVVGLTPSAFQGPMELGARLATEPLVESCSMKHLFRYFAGRTEADGDSCAIEELTTAFVEEGGSLRGAVVRLVRSEGFRRIGGAR